MGLWRRQTGLFHWGASSSSPKHEGQIRREQEMSAVGLYARTKEWWQYELGMGLRTHSGDRTRTMDKENHERLSEVAWVDSHSAAVYFLSWAMILYIYSSCTSEKSVICLLRTNVPSSTKAQANHTSICVCQIQMAAVSKGKNPNIFSAPCLLCDSQAKNGRSTYYCDYCKIIYIWKAAGGLWSLPQYMLFCPSCDFPKGGGLSHICSTLA